jgi:hypothetical protein
LFNIDCNGLLTNISGLNYTTYHLTVTVNDTFNNATSYEISINVTNDIISPSITLLNPDDSHSTSSQGVSFEYQVSDANSIVNCSLMIGNAINSTSFGVARDISRTFYITLPAGTYNWGVNCFDEYNNLGNSSKRNLVSTYSPSTTTQTNTSSNTTTSASSSTTTTTTTTTPVEKKAASTTKTTAATTTPATTPAQKETPPVVENTTTDKNSDAITGNSIGNNIKNNLGWVIGVVLLLVLIVVFLTIKHRKKANKSILKK